MKPIILCIMDGWGISNETNHNAIKMGNTPVFDKLLRKYPNGVMQASGAHVGLPSGQMGNSEVGHMNLGAGRIVLQDLPRINNIIENGLLADNLTLTNLIKEAKSSNGKCHLIGLLSDGGVHSHQSHLEGIANYLSNAGIEVCFHAILDGRDTSPQSAKDFVKQFQENTHDAVSIATLIGRFYAMDRDSRWERIEKAFNAIVNANGKDGNDPILEIETQYQSGTTDEFLEPVILNSYSGIQDGDTLLFGNFRADRARELLSAIFEPNFFFFNRPYLPIINSKAGLVSYSESLDKHLDILIPKFDIFASLVAGSLIVVLAFFFQKTKTGLSLRAVSDDHMAAMAVGIPLQTVWAVVWAVTGVIALVAGLLWAERVSVSFTLIEAVMKALPVILIGGLTSIPGAIIGGLVIGVGEKLGEIYLADVFGGQGIELWFAYFMALIFLVFRPQGMFGEKLIERV